MSNDNEELKRHNIMAESYEPKFEGRWVCKFPEEFSIPTYVIEKITRPKINIPTCEINQNNCRINYCSGKPQWENIEIYLYDPITPSMSQAIQYNIIEKNKFTDFIIIVETLSPTGESIEQWRIDVDTIIKIDFGEWDYKSKNPIKIKMIIKPKNCQVIF